MLTKIHLFMVSISAWVSVWRRSKTDARALLTEMCHEFKNGKRNRLSLVFWEKLIVPNFRLRMSIKLGRPSPSVYKKFFPILNTYIKKEKLQCDLKRQLPKFLIIRDGAMGDVLMITPTIRNLYRAHNGKVVIHVATHYAGVFDNSPYVEKVLDTKSISKGVHDYDGVINLNGVYERCPKEHPVIAYKRFALGSGDSDNHLELFPSFEDRSFVEKVVNLISKPYVVVHQMHHEWPNRNIPYDIWDSITSQIVGKLGLKIIYVGSGPGVYGKNDGFCEDHRNRYSLQQLSLLISHSVGFIGADSGPSHIAATTEASICTFYTCAHHEVRMPMRAHGRFLPLFPDIECYGCLAGSPIANSTYFCQRGDNACVSSEYLGDVARKVISFLTNSY
jgi:ADP-heptose:LPS heptosyltransferase